MPLTDYRTLGRSGLRVSPAALGTMTFGTEWGFGADEAECGRMLARYLELGGNFIDSANFYTGGAAETLLGRLLAGQRERVVLATKYSLSMDPANPNAGGNHRRSMVRAVEASLRRLDTDYIDLLYLHAWDDTTPGDEVMRAFDDLVRAGKVLYPAISDTPAWRIARMQTQAELRGWSPFAAVQLEFSLVEHSSDHELLPMAEALGLGVTGWSVLAFGVLTGKYGATDLQDESLGGERRAGADKDSGAEQSVRRRAALAHGQLSERSLAIAQEVGVQAELLGCSPAQLAIAWALSRSAPAVIPILGARTLAQLDDNLGALGLEPPAEVIAQLDAVSRVAPGFPHQMLALPLVRQNLFGHCAVRRSAATLS